MDVRFVSSAGIELFDADALPALLGRTDGLVWVDIPVWDEEAEQALKATFGFHPLAIRDSANRNQVPGFIATTTICSLCCTRRSPASVGTCTTSNLTSSSGTATW